MHVNELSTTSSPNYNILSQNQNFELTERLSALMDA